MSVSLSECHCIRMCVCVCVCLPLGVLVGDLCCFVFVSFLLFCFLLFLCFVFFCSFFSFHSALSDIPVSPSPACRPHWSCWLLLLRWSGASYYGLSEAGDRKNQEVGRTGHGDQDPWRTCWFGVVGFVPRSQTSFRPRWAGDVMSSALQTG